MLSIETIALFVIYISGWCGCFVASRQMPPDNGHAIDAILALIWPVFFISAIVHKTLLLPPRR
jgi:hypothetical protein